MTRYLIYLFTTPSSYIDDWRGFLANQAGHGAIGLVAAHVVGWWALAGYAAWEIAQYRYSRGKSLWRGSQLRVGATVSDCIGDWVFVASGVLAVVAHPAALMITGGMLASGVLERRGR